MYRDETDEKVNILIVDDNESNLLAMRSVLEVLGENLITASSGEEALRQLLVREFAVILLDIQMPGIDGFETASLIREREKCEHTPIIFLTGISKSPIHIFRGYSLGAVDFMLKPIVPEILTTKVSVFVTLYNKTREVKRQAELLRQYEERERGYVHAQQSAIVKS